MVLNRWAMMKAVRPEASFSISFWMSSSLFMSREAVASSSTRIGAFFRKALARETRCRWPPESPSPISPIMRE